MAGPQSFVPPSVKPSKVKRRFTLEQANKSLPLVTRIVADIVKTHQEAIRLQTKLETHKNAREAAKMEQELELKEARLQELVAELGGVGCELKDYQMGLVDWIGRHKGRDVLLCWKLGEQKIGYWHELQTGFSGRQPVSTLEEQE